MIALILFILLNLSAPGVDMCYIENDRCIIVDDTDPTINN
jgi:hypothetical protein